MDSPGGLSRAQNATQGQDGLVFNFLKGFLRVANIYRLVRSTYMFQVAQRFSKLIQRGNGGLNMHGLHPRSVRKVQGICVEKFVVGQDSCS